MSSASAAMDILSRGGGHEYLQRAQILKAEALTRLGLYKPARQALDAVAAPRSEALHARLLLARSHMDRLDGAPEAAWVQAERALALARRAGVLPVAAACNMILARLARDQARGDDRDEALAYCRKAVLDLEICGQPALEAEALYLAAGCARRPGQVEAYMTSAEDAWQRATTGLTSAMIDGFASTEERKPLRDALKRRDAEGYRLTFDDQAAILAILAAPPELSTLFAAIVALVREDGRAERIAIYWEDAHGKPRLAIGEGSPVGGHDDPTSEMEAAREASTNGRGDEILMLALDTGGDPEQPWGAVLMSGVAADRHDRLAKVLTPLGGALWAARQFKLGPTAPATMPEGVPAVSRIALPPPI